MHVIYFKLARSVAHVLLSEYCIHNYIYIALQMVAERTDKEINLLAITVCIYFYSGRYFYSILSNG